MKSQMDEPAKRTTYSFRIACVCVVLVSCVTIAIAQAQPAESAAAVSKSQDSKQNDFKPSLGAPEVLYLSNATKNNDLADAQAGLRNMVPSARIYAIQPLNAIVVRGTPEDMKAVKQLLAELDRPKKTYRLTYTITEKEGGKRIGAQHLTLIAAANQTAEIKQGNRIPILTATKESGGSQIQYVDVGLNIGASFDGVQLRTSVEQYGIAEDKPNTGAPAPIIRQVTLQAATTFVPGKPIVLGSLDIPGTARNQEIEVVVEPVL